MRIGHRASRAHGVEAELRLQRPDQDGFGNAFRLTYHIETPMVAINEIDVTVTGRTPHGAIAFGFAAKCMTARIAHQIGSCFENSPAARPVWAIANQPMAQQSVCD